MGAELSKLLVLPLTACLGRVLSGDSECQCGPNIKCHCRNTAAESEDEDLPTLDKGG